MLAKTYRDDEYYTTKENAEKFFELVVKLSGILKHRTIVMPFSSNESQLYKVATRYHNNVIHFEGDFDLWKNVTKYVDVAVIDNPPFSMSSRIEQLYFKQNVPFILFRSAIIYPKFIANKDSAGVIYENSQNGVTFEWGFTKHIKHDDYIKNKYPNLLDNLKSVGALNKNIPTAFSFYKTDYKFKVKTITFSELRYPRKKDVYVYLNRGVFDENTQIWIDEKDGRIHLLSY